MSNNIKIYMKEMGDASWTDVSSSCIKTTFKIRKGFGSFGSASDVSKLSIEYKADDLASATLFHTAIKQIRVKSNGIDVFEGYTYGDASVKSTNDVNLAWVKLSAYPYAHALEKSIASASEIIEGYKVLDPTDENRSLVHYLLNRMIESLDEPFRSVLQGYNYAISSDLSITSIANPVLIEEGDSYLDILNALFSEFGLAYYIENNYMVIVKPYATDGRAVQNIAINDILINPSFKNKPYKKDRKYSLTVAKIVTENDQSVYQLREEGDIPSKDDAIPVNGYYPEEAELEASYETSSENETRKLLYATGLSYDYKATSVEDQPVTLAFEVAELKEDSATFKIKNNNNKAVYLNQLTVNASKVYYKDTSLSIAESDSKARETEDYETRFLSSSTQAEDYIKHHHAEDKAERFSATFSSDKVVLEPNSLVTIGTIPFTILVRYIETNLATGMSDFTGVAYSVDAVGTTSKVKKNSATGALQYISLSLDGFAYTYDADGNLEPSDQLIRATVKRFGIADNPVWTIGNTVLDTTATTIEIPASYMTGSVISVSVKVGEFTSSDYIYKLTQGSQGKDAIPPKYQWRLGSSSTEPPVDTINHLDNGSVTIFDGTILAEANTGWLDVRPTPTADLPYIWERMSSDGGLTWSAPYCLSINTIKNIEVVSSHASFNLNSRGVCETLQTITCSIVRYNTIDPCFWTVTKDGNLTDIVATEGDSITFSVAVGETTKNIEVSAVCSGMARAVNIFGKISGIVAPKKMNGIIENITQLDSITTLNNDGVTPLVMGDYALVRIPNGENHYLGVFRWSGASWESVNGNESNYSEIMSGVLADALSDTTTVYPSYSAIYGFFQNLAVNSAFIESLTANSAFIESLTVWSLLVEKSKFSCEIGVFNNVPIFDVKYDGTTIFKVDPSTGKVFLGTPNAELTAPETGFMYNPETGSIVSKNKNIEIDANGKIHAENGDFNGNIFAQSGTIECDIDTPSFSAKEGPPQGEKQNIFTIGTGAQTQFNNLLNMFNTLGWTYNQNYTIYSTTHPTIKRVYYTPGSASEISFYSDTGRVGTVSRRSGGSVTYSTDFNTNLELYTTTIVGGQIFKFKTIPVSDVDLEVGTVYRTSDGTLKVKI